VCAFFVLRYFAHLVTHFMWPRRPENPPERPRAQRTSPWRRTSLFLSFCLYILWKLEASTARWSSWFHL